MEATMNIPGQFSRIGHKTFFLLNLWAIMIVLVGSGSALASDASLREKKIDALLCHPLGAGFSVKEANWLKPGDYGYIKSVLGDPARSECWHDAVFALAMTGQGAAFAFLKAFVDSDVASWLNAGAKPEFVGSAILVTPRAMGLISNYTQDNALVTSIVNHLMINANHNLIDSSGNGFVQKYQVFYYPNKAFLHIAFVKAFIAGLGYMNTKQALAALDTVGSLSGFPNSWRPLLEECKSRVNSIIQNGIENY